MSSYLLFSRLYQLHCCNKVLISLYNRIFTTDVSRKNICLQRLNDRSIIKAELQESIVKLRNQKMILAEKPFIYLFCKTFDTMPYVVSKFISSDYDTIAKWESKNLHLYYLTLYTPNAPGNITDMLLRQKKVIEENSIQSF